MRANHYILSPGNGNWSRDRHMTQDILIEYTTCLNEVICPDLATKPTRVNQNTYMAMVIAPELGT